ncbi:hypothetical protein RJ55_02365 [Drechmeria coniospora]|nr:hypothetical protein RJ55_02365 [Drechmeria coniospora]
MESPTGPPIQRPKFRHGRSSEPGTPWSKSRSDEAKLAPANEARQGGKATGSMVKDLLARRNATSGQHCTGVGRPSHRGRICCELAQSRAPFAMVWDPALRIGQEHRISEGVDRSNGAAFEPRTRWRNGQQQGVPTLRHSADVDAYMRIPASAPMGPHRALGRSLVFEKDISVDFASRPDEPCRPRGCGMDMLRD